MIHALESFPFDGSTESQVSCYEKTISTVLDLHCPVTTRTRMLKSNPPWYNAEIHLARRTQRKCERTWRKSGHAEDRQKYLDPIHQLSKVIRQENPNHLLSTDTKTVFNRSVVSLPPSDSMKSPSNRFCNYFKEKITKIRQSSLSDPNVQQAEPQHLTIQCCPIV